MRPASSHAGGVDEDTCMKPGKLDLPIIWRGCAWLDIALDWKDQDGQPINLEGFIPLATMRDGTSLNARVINAAQGKTRLGLSTAETANLKLGVQDWDWLWGSADPYTVLPPFLSGQVPVQQPKSHIDPSSFNP
jgi:hypothetical protein